MTNYIAIGVDSGFDKDGCPTVSGSKHIIGEGKPTEEQWKVFTEEVLKRIEELKLKYK
jgi:hypothetical protein